MSNLPPEQMTARPRFCTCGHIEATHYSWNTGAPGSKCHATIWDVFTSGATGSECKCSAFTTSDGLQTVAPKDSDSPAGTGTGKTE